MNFYSCEVSARTQIVTHTLTHVARSAVLEILNLSAALFIQGAEIAEIHDLDKLNDKQRLLIEAVEKLLVQVRDTALLLMDMLRVSTYALVCTISSLHQRIYHRETYRIQQNWH